MLLHTTKNFFIVFCGLYIYAKLINRPPKIKNVLLWIIFSMLSGIAASFAREYIAPFNMLIFYAAILIYSILSYRMPINLSLVLSTLSLSMSLLFYTVSIFICVPVTYILYSTINNLVMLDTIASLFTGIFNIFSVFLFFKIKRFKNGLISYEKRLNNDISVFISILVLFLFILVYSSKQLYLYYGEFLILILVLCAILFVFWWKKHIKNIYLEKINQRNTEILENALSEHKETIKYLKKHNEELSKLIHRDNKMIPAMELAVEEILKCTSPEEQKEKSKSLLAQIQAVSADRKLLLEKYENSNIKLAETGIVSIDAGLRYLFWKAKEKEITFDITLGADLKKIIKSVISENDLNTLILDLVENAVISVSCSESPRHILFTTDIEKGNICINVYDSGADFNSRVIEYLGIKRFTTHKNSGGSGIGLMTTIETIKECQASFIIDETIKNNCYRKKVSVNFDGLNQIRIYSNRDEILKIRRKRNDIVFY